MKKAKLKIMAAVLAVWGLLGGQVLRAQSTNGLGGIILAAENSGLLSASNYSFNAYVTYAPTLPKHVGGGFIAIYNVNDYVGVGLGGDELGRFNILSANATLQLPVHPFTFITQTNGILASLATVAIVPFQLMGAAAPLSGTGGTSSGGPGAVLIEDTGGYFQFGRVFGGSLDAGAAWGQWDNAGLYSGKRYHFFVGWSKNLKVL